MALDDPSDAGVVLSLRILREHPSYHAKSTGLGWKHHGELEAVFREATVDRLLSAVFGIFLDFFLLL